MLAFNDAAAESLNLGQLKAAVFNRNASAGQRNERKEVLMKQLKEHWQQPVEIEKLTRLGAEVELKLLGMESPKGSTASELRKKLREAQAKLKPQETAAMDALAHEDEAPEELAPQEPKDPEEIDATKEAEVSEAPKKLEELEASKETEAGLLAELAELRQMKEAMERKKAEKEARKKAEEEARKKAEEDAAADAAAAEAAAAEEAEAEAAVDEEYRRVYAARLEEERKVKPTKKRRETLTSPPRKRITKSQEEAYEKMQFTAVKARFVRKITKRGFQTAYVPGKPWDLEAGTNALTLPRPGGDRELQLGFVVHGQTAPFYKRIDDVANVEKYKTHPGLRDAAQCVGCLSRPLSELREEEAQYEARAMTDWLMRQQQQPVDP